MTVDWRKAPKGTARGAIQVAGPDGATVAVRVDIVNPATPSKATLRGFVEADGYVSMEAEHFTRKVDAAAARWEKLDDYGKTLSAMTLFPVTASSVAPPQNSPRLEYEMYLFEPGRVEVESILGPSQNFVPAADFASRSLLTTSRRK